MQGFPCFQEIQNHGPEHHQANDGIPGSQLLWFINQDFSNRGLGDYEGAELQIVFNRDILINETESIENCSKSVGILSTETIVEQHPWVTDVEVELARLRKEKDEAMEQAQEYAGAFQTGNQNKGDNGEGE